MLLRMNLGGHVGVPDITGAFVLLGLCAFVVLGYELVNAIIRWLSTHRKKS